MNFLGEKILIVGASSGIGRSVAVLLSGLGAQCAIVARREAELGETLSMLSGNGHRMYTADVSNLDGIEPLMKKITAECGALSGLVYSAGVSSSRPLNMLKPQVLQDVMTVNFNAFVEVVRCFCKKGNFVESGASIVGVSSISSLRGNKSKLAYAASKAAMDGAVRCLGKELAPKHIRINTVRPGLTKTVMYDAFKENGNGSDDMQDILNRQFLGVAEPEDIANSIAFLLDDASRMITGGAIDIDCGRLCC